MLSAMDEKSNHAQIQLYIYLIEVFDKTSKFSRIPQFLNTEIRLNYDLYDRTWIAVPSKKPPRRSMNIYEICTQ